jgi:hypothetical protein
MMIKAVWFRGKPTCPCVKTWLPWLERVYRLRGVIKKTIDIAQLTGAASASGGTHKGGGAFDLWQASDLAIEISRQMGADASWTRTPAQGFPFHQHGVLRNCPHNLPARYQIDAVDDGYNGLGKGGRGGRDDGPRPLSDRTWQEGIIWAKIQIRQARIDTLMRRIEKGKASPIRRARRLKVRRLRKAIAKGKAALR